MLYLWTIHNHRMMLVVLAMLGQATASMDYITTVAGSGSTGYGTGSFSGDGFSASSATLNLPIGVAVDTSGIILPVYIN